MRLPVSILTDWVTGGYSLEEFEDGFHVGLDKLKVAVDYFNNNPPVHVVDLRNCEEVELRPDGTPVLRNAGLPVEMIINHFKGGRTPEQISDRLELPLHQIKAVLGCSATFTNLFTSDYNTS